MAFHQVPAEDAHSWGASGHAALGPEPWGSPRPRRLADQRALRAPPPRGRPSSPPPLQEDKRGGSTPLPCRLMTLGTETHILSMASRALGRWALLSSHQLLNTPAPPTVGLPAGRSGPGVLAPHTAPPHGWSGAWQAAPPPPGLGVGRTPSSRRTRPSAHAVLAPDPNLGSTSDCLWTRVLTAALTLVASEGHISVWRTAWSLAHGTGSQGVSE